MALFSVHYKKNLAIFAWIRRIGNKVRYLPIVLIDLYRYLISPFTIPSCRFYPTCSAYARSALIKYGLFKGGIMTLKRICKCHPFHPGGYDPVD